MLFQVRAKHYPDLGVVLFYLPAERNLLAHPSLLEDVQFTGVAPAIVSTDHVAGSSSSRYARAATTVTVQLDRPPEAEHPVAQGEPYQQALEAFRGFISTHLEQERPMVEALQKAYGIETLGWTGLQTITVRVEVQVPYSVKGLRNDEARNQRAEDALAMAQYQLSHGWQKLACEQLDELQHLLRECIEVCNQAQVKPLMTQIDLGLFPQKSYADEVAHAKEAHAAALDELNQAQLRVEASWKKYSEAYKRSVNRDLHEQYPVDGLLEYTLSNRIELQSPLRYL